VYSDNVSGAGNQQERPAIEAIDASLGSFLSGFALGEASFMMICRRRSGSARGFRLSAAFNVSQHDRAPLDLFRDALGCGTMRVAGNGGWRRQPRLVMGGQRFARSPRTHRSILRALSARRHEGAGL
jgi:hypothetical protein